MENHLIYYLETYTSSEIIAQATIFTVLVVVLHHFFEIFPCFHYQTVLITDAKVIYYIGTAIRANGDLLTETVICRSLLPKANGGGDRGVHVHSQRAMQSIFCSVHGDTMTR